MCALLLLRCPVLCSGALTLCIRYVISCLLTRVFLNSPQCRGPCFCVEKQRAQAFTGRGCYGLMLGFRVFGGWKWRVLEIRGVVVQ